MATDRYVDLLKQGFMKPRKSRLVTVFQVWLPNDEGMMHEGTDEITAHMLAYKYSGEVRRAKRETK